MVNVGIATDDILTSSRIVITLSAIGTALGLKLLTDWVTARKKNDEPKPTEAELLADLDERKPRIYWNTVLFFPDYSAHMEDSVTQQFLWYFAQARTSIRICIYNFSFRELESVIVQQYNLGLIVQFIVGTESTAENLRKRSIPCGLLPRENIPTTDKLMHHKFAIIDDEAVLAGSMNWTVEAVITNKENVCVTTNPSHVKKYISEFFKLQRICEDAKAFY